ncbi:redoxin domain-containing protein [Cellulomonas sp. URHD0024]|uniref:redoxin domain-containing protein n=1 Tax=Cellulomonas sp. URHD0024 TaxID=1302620 RepID=UPI00040B249B|nr:redoxin domain-containing protein [Cellulomonas sp. URHD0024]
MPLDLGSTLTFEVQEADGSPFDLTDYRGTHHVLVYFMRALSCMQCNAHVRVLVAQQEAFEADRVQVVIAVPEDAAAAAAWKAKKGIPYPVVVGRAGTPHAEVGLLRKAFGALQQSGAALLDSAGVVRYSHTSTNPGSSYSKADVAAAIRDLPAIV